MKVYDHLVLMEEPSIFVYN